MTSETGQTLSSAPTAGQLLWTPDSVRVERAQITKFLRWLERERRLIFTDYEGLWRWSVTEGDCFWRAIWDYFGIFGDAPAEVVSGTDILRARWFLGARVNYAEHLLRHESVATSEEVALVYCSEVRPVATMTWSELGGQVRRLATRLRQIGVQPGDRVVSYMPNIPETAVAMLATVAIGAVWSSAAPEFGSKMVLERFGQLEPKVAFFADGYQFNGRVFDRRAEIVTIANGLSSLTTLIWLPYVGLERDVAIVPRVVEFADLLKGPEIAAAEFKYKRVPSDHPLWILFSSGTTGLPKAIAHGHAGMVAEHLKAMALHCDLGPGRRMFFYSTTGWMMWNAVMASLIVGAAAILYDGSPFHGGADALWRIADETGATVFGASPTLIQTMKKENVRPALTFDLRALDTIILGGAPSTPETFGWIYENVRQDLWVTSQTGGTELCSSLLAGTPALPVHAGELQVRALGIDVQVWNENGEEIFDDVGELIVAKPFPSAPLFFWGDAGDVRYHDSYFTTYSGIWRHGDLAKFNSRGGAYLYGRSDATLNRFGVRIGSAELYRVLEQIPEIADALVVCCEMPRGEFYMPLFVALGAGRQLDEDLKSRIVVRLRTDASPRHVPDEIHQAPAIPYTLTGKRMEVPVRKLIMGVPPERAASTDAMGNPASLNWFVEFATRGRATRDTD